MFSFSRVSIVKSELENTLMASPITENAPSMAGVKVPHRWQGTLMLSSTNAFVTDTPDGKIRPQFGQDAGTLKVAN